MLAYAGFVWEVTCGGASLLPDWRRNCVALAQSSEYKKVYNGDILPG